MVNTEKLQEYLICLFNLQQLVLGSGGHEAQKKWDICCNWGWGPTVEPE